jgi:hypothetical protein
MYSWENNPVAILGTVYLYFAHGRHEGNISQNAMATFIATHQDAEGQLTDSKVRAAVQAVRRLDTGDGMYRPSQRLEAIWAALQPVHNQF